MYHTRYENSSQVLTALAMKITHESYGLVWYFYGSCSIILSHSNSIQYYKITQCLYKLLSHTFALMTSNCLTELTKVSSIIPYPISDKWRQSAYIKLFGIDGRR